MCGIAGVLAPAEAGSEAHGRVVSEMTGRMVHRGPDRDGLWSDASSGVALGHRRLAIVELGPEGHQPMLSVGGRYVVVFNGEIYNYPEIRARLLALDPALRFRGDSDTEVMLAAFEAWGVREAVSVFNGMFAFALWDRKERVLFLARDRMGEKPLYFGWDGRRFLFASELKAIARVLRTAPEIDRDALAQFMRFSCVPAPRSIYRGFYKLPAATLLEVSKKRARDPRGFQASPDSPRDAASWGPERYWSASQACARGRESVIDASVDEIVAQADALLRDAVRLRMHADVPLGAFLSGGIDSTTVVAMMQAQSRRPVKTFTIGFREAAYNEAVDARRVAEHLGTEHTEHILSSEEALAVIPKLSQIYDEPFADASQIPTFLVSGLARRHVTVALTGDGGDEVFGGYTRYLWAEEILGKVDRIPRGLRPVVSGLLRRLSPGQWERFGKILAPILGRYGKQGTFGDKMHKVAEVLEMRDLEALYLRLVSAWLRPGEVVRGAGANPSCAWTDGLRRNGSRPYEQMMLYDQSGYLPDDILVKLDRASMAVSLEGRMPFLDHRVVEFGWKVPSSLRLGGGKGKVILRRILQKYIPLELIDRPKMGFGVPIDEWLRGPLRDWAESLLNESCLREQGHLNDELIRARWSDHLSGRRNWGQSLWCVLMFQSWLESQKPVVAP